MEPSGNRVIRASAEVKAKQSAAGIRLSVGIRLSAFGHGTLPLNWKWEGLIRGCLWNPRVSA